MSALLGSYCTGHIAAGGSAEEAKNPELINLNPKPSRVVHPCSCRTGPSRAGGSTDSSFASQSPGKRGGDPGTSGDGSSSQSHLSSPDLRPEPQPSPADTDKLPSSSGALPPGYSAVFGEQVCMSRCHGAF